ncbi:MAG: hypothetical protein FJ240_03270 [Nitrospira sp.]|nr:hypothetical protein [Nitrospira sp.]
MKKIALYISILSILFVFLSCGAGGVSSKGSSQINVTATFKDFNAAAGVKAASSTLLNIRYTVSGPGMTTIKGIAPVLGNMVEIKLDVPNGTQRLFVIEALDALDNVKYAGSAKKDLDGTPASIEIILSYNPLVGTWGYVRIQHENGGDWESTAGKIILNADGTGSNPQVRNDFDDNLANEQYAGTFTYSVERSQDGSLLFKGINDENGEVNFHRIFLSDDFKLMLFDYTVELDEQNMLIAVRMDPAKIYSNADTIGEYFKIGYAYEAAAGAAAKYNSDSSIFTFDGIGSISVIGKANSDGGIHDFTNSHTYSFRPDGLVTFDNGGMGYLSGDNKLFVRSIPDIMNAFRFRFGIKKGDRIYSTTDLAGTWVLASFGDGNNGSSFFSHLGMWTCNSSGNCNISGRRQVNGIISSTPDNRTFSVAPDGSFGASFAANMPSYVAAMGSNGNVFLMNRSFGDSTLRRISIGARCSGCSNIAELTGITGKWLIYRTPQGGTERGPACVYITQTGNLFITKGYSEFGLDFNAGGSINGDQVQFESGFKECDKEAHGPVTGVVNGNAMNGTYTLYGGCGNDSGTWRAVKGECPSSEPLTQASVRIALYSDGYRLDFYVDQQPGAPVINSVTVSGPDIDSLNLNLECQLPVYCPWHRTVFFGTAKPNSGNTYTFNINYNNGTSETLTDTVSDIGVGMPVLLSPQDGAILNTTTPNFVWQPSTGCAAWYHLVVSDSNGNAIWWPQISNGNTSAIYNFDGTAIKPLEVGNSYMWGVNAIDDCLNQNDGHDNLAGAFGGTFTVQ